MHNAHRRRRQCPVPSLLLPTSTMTNASTSSTKIYIPDDVPFRNGNEYLHPVEYDGDLEGVLLTEHELLDRTKSLAKDIARDYASSDKVVELLCVLKGSIVFFQHLMHALAMERLPFGIHFIRVKSYEGTSSTGNLRILDDSDLVEQLKGKHVIVVEDIVDTGVTLSKLLPLIREQFQPFSVEACTLLEKRIPNVASRAVYCRYIGFSIPNHFIIGFGLDFNETYRDLLDIWVISQQGIQKGGRITRKKLSSEMSDS